MTKSTRPSSWDMEGYFALPWLATNPRLVISLMLFPLASGLACACRQGPQSPKRRHAGL